MNNPYESPAALPAEPLSAGRGGVALLGICLAALPALVCWLVASRFREALEGFGAELPALSSFVFNYHPFLWLAPVVVAAVVLISPPHARSRRAMALGTISLLILAPLCVIALYLPIFKLGTIA